MSLYFIANNLHFTLELVGAVVFFVMAWLAVDSYRVGKHFSSIFRVLGLCLVGAWQVVHAFSISSDIVNFFGFSAFILGLILIIISFLSTPRIASLSAVLIIPSFSGILPPLEIIAAILLSTIAYLVYSQMKNEHNPTLRSLCFGFVFFALGSFVMISSGAQTSDNILWYIAHTLEIMGFLSFTFWVWQYLRMRIHESLILIFITMTLFIATIVTLAFSTILISKIEEQTRASLLTDAKVFDFSVHNLMDKSSAEAKFISIDKNISDALSSNDTSRLEIILAQYLDTEKLGFLLVTDKTGTVVMRAHSRVEYGDSIAYERAVEEALVGNPFTTIESSKSEKFSIRSSSPIYKDGKIIGTVVAGFPLDNVMVDGIKKITGLDATLYQADLAIATTSLASDGRSRLTGVIIDDKAVKESVFLRGETATTRVVIKNIPFLASYLPIVDTDGKIIGMFSAAKPQAEILEIANSTNRLTLITVTILLLLLAFPVYILTKRLLESAL